MIIQFEAWLDGKAVHARHIGKVRKRKFGIAGKKFGKRAQMFARHEHGQLPAKR